MNDITGHDSLCCEFPNGKVKDNPYKELEPARYYKEILNLFRKIDNLPIERQNMEDKECAELSKKISELIKKYKI